MALCGRTTSSTSNSFTEAVGPASALWLSDAFGEGAQAHDHFERKTDAMMPVNPPLKAFFRRSRLGIGGTPECARGSDRSAQDMYPLAFAPDCERNPLAPSALRAYFSVIVHPKGAEKPGLCVSLLTRSPVGVVASKPPPPSSTRP
ncbi:hypothetical protein PUNSTDRAFT_138551 [Punctularia strigosozonata HHB-11173 SS5]|uniref:Uncharacterized protein n=1 Tax=Punctularia strigosozonata (strain HHB-11173) TaxID=741275 RepID=R7S3S3_PUNST|nr:uncharacterized protein PUNSTDRAFT_138551 [Punctularia strigosozonata HHB-11173 SS5]EIN04509.1 hypothetical protein PUNSTDRAFT_138551 [Punctularia strigosozonata HHB-11173 SS5]